MQNQIRAKAVKVPEDCSYITEGNVYKVAMVGNILFSVVDDTGDIIMCCFDGLCGHGISWERVE